MASPTIGELFTRVANLTDIVDELDKYLNANTPNWLGQQDTITQALEGNYTDGEEAALASVREGIQAGLSPESLRAIYSDVLLDLAEVIGATERQPAAIFNRLKDYMTANTQTVQQRQISFGTPSAGGSNVGNGTLLRLTEDENNEPIQAVHFETITVECVRDQSSGAAEHEEAFEIRGLPAERDYAAVVGSGQSGSLGALSARQSRNLLSNPSFSQLSGSAGTGNLTGLTDWTVTTDVTNNMEINESTVYRDFVGDTTPRSLFITADDKISQIIKDTRNATLSEFVPYWMQVAVFPTTGTSAGNIILRMGATSRTVALTGLTPNAWNIVGIVSGGPDSTCWLKTFNEADLSIEVEIASLAGGTGVYVDDVLFCAGQQFNNCWYWIVPAAASNTPWKLADVFTFSDSLTSEGKINKWMGWRTGWGWLPSTTGSPTYADPT